MGPGEHRPYDDQYWARPWATALFAGDLFEAVPFGEQPTVLYSAEDGPGIAKHFVGEIARLWPADHPDVRHGRAARGWRRAPVSHTCPRGSARVRDRTNARGRGQREAAPQPRHAPSVHVSADASGRARAGVGRVSLPAEPRRRRFSF